MQTVVLIFYKYEKKNYRVNFVVVYIMYFNMMKSKINKNHFSLHDLSV